MKYSLHLGLNRVDPAAYGGWPGFLSACENDASGLASALAARGFFARLLLNENCTLAEFSTHLTALAQQARAGDVVVVSFSGHGGQQYSLTEPDGYNETLCLFDGQLVDDDFVRLLAQFAPGVNAVVILDCCHAGGDDREVPVRRKRSAPDTTWLHSHPKQQDGNPRQSPDASLALLCACQEDETASDGIQFGAWTGALLEALPAASTVKTWFTIASAHCPRGQHPVLHLLGQAGVLNQSLQ